VTEFHYVYTLQSLSHPTQIYTGQTNGLRKRVREHNSGKVPYTSKFKPWGIRSATAFPDRARALNFERYLKSGSGRAFLHRDL